MYGSKHNFGFFKLQKYDLSWLKVPIGWISGKSNPVYGRIPDIKKAGLS
jgi:hypothetical protein